MNRRVAVFTGALALASTAGVWWTASAQSQRRRMEQPARYASRGTRGAVTAGTDAAADAGMRLLYQGGNAVDSGVAAMYAASVVEYSHFGFGGEAPILIRTKEGKVVALAGVGTMPKSATAELFRTRKMLPGEVQNLEPNGLKGMVPAAGIMPALVPGMVDAGLVALREYGTRSFADVIAPAIELADGAPFDEVRAGSIMRSRKFFELWPSSQKFYLGDGSPVAPGMIFRQPDLARTLRAMVAEESRALKGGAGRQAGIDAVRDYFYRGDVARKIDAFSKANDGLLRYEDMAAFRVQPEEAASTTYRGYTIHKPGFWSQGPTLIETLNMLEGYDLASMQHNSTRYIHTVTEAMKLAYADRDTYYGDPRFVKVATERLLSKSYAEERRAEIRERASMAFEPGLIDGKRGLHPSQSQIVRIKIDDELMARDTTCINAADASGLVFSATPSGAWLPSVIAGDTGIPLTQRAQSFLLVDGHPNELAGGKRPRVTLSPTMVTLRGKPFLALSTPGGDNQDQALLQLILNVVDFGMNAQMALELGRFQTRHMVSSFDNHAMNAGDLILDERTPPSVIGELAQKGHQTSTRSRWSSGSAPTMIRFTPMGTIEAGADPYGYRTARAW
ncbi:MAG: gamma-glutamyltranspeptidase [Acidobacteria bacterium]|nr:gamma-glutamyltranspeptidase [Acidobacteriota bacterium]